MQKDELIIDMNKKYSKEEYNKEPVYYCSRCLSLNIIILSENVDYCDNCGCTDIQEASLDNWKALYKLRYGKDLIPNKEE